MSYTINVREIKDNREGEMTKQITAKEMAAKINEIAPKALYKAEIISADKVISRELEHHATAEQVREMDPLRQRQWLEDGWARRSVLQELEPPKHTNSPLNPRGLFLSEWGRTRRWRWTS